MTSALDSSSLTMHCWFPPLVRYLPFKADRGVKSNLFYPVKSLPACFAVYLEKLLLTGCPCHISAMLRVENQHLPSLGPPASP